METGLNACVATFCGGLLGTIVIRKMYSLIKNSLKDISTVEFA